MCVVKPHSINNRHLLSLDTDGRCIVRLIDWRGNPLASFLLTDTDDPAFACRSHPLPSSYSRAVSISSVRVFESTTVSGISDPVSSRPAGYSNSMLENWILRLKADAGEGLKSGSSGRRLPVNPLASFLLTDTDDPAFACRSHTLPIFASVHLGEAIWTR